MIPKTLLLLLVLAPLMMAPASAQGVGNRLSGKKWAEEQRQDEYALSLRRRDWLKDRLILQVGFGSKYPVMGETGFGYGAGIEYITRWHLAPFATFGIVPERKDSEIPEENLTLQGLMAYKAGLAYYLFPKSPLHIGLAASYGHVYFDHIADPVGDNKKQDATVREIIPIMGWQGDFSISYLTNEWYYLNFVVGMYYAPKAKEESTVIEISTNQERSLVVGSKGIPKQGLVFGIGIGFALPEFFPDDTEERRRIREEKRRKGDPAPKASSRRR